MPAGRSNPQRVQGTHLALRWRLRPGWRARTRFFGASVRAVSGPVLARWGVFRRPARRTSTRSAARRGHWAAARPRRGLGAAALTPLNSPRRRGLQASKGPSVRGWLSVAPGVKFGPASRPASWRKPRADNFTIASFSSPYRNSTAQTLCRPPLFPLCRRRDFIGAPVVVTTGGHQRLPPPARASPTRTACGGRMGCAGRADLHLCRAVLGVV